jgi:hypothetical protein
VGCGGGVWVTNNNATRKPYYFYYYDADWSGEAAEE